MRISVIIPTLNAGVYLEQLLHMISTQDIGSSEIIIIDSSSEDNTLNIAKRFGVKTIVIPRHTFSHGGTRNLAVKESTGDILIFMTHDALPMNNALFKNLTAPLEMSDIAATFARQIPRSDASPLELSSRRFNYPGTGAVKGLDDIKKHGIKTFFFSNVCSSFKKNLFIKFGMFPENVRSNEDMLITAKLILNGYKVAYVPEAMVIHSHNLSLPQQFRRYYNIGSSLKSNKWILQYANAEGEGVRLVKEQLRFVFKHHKYRWIPLIFLESVTKYLGYRIGLISG
jgi:rhamnosyltransferase